MQAPEIIDVASPAERVLDCSLCPVLCVAHPRGATMSVHRNQLRQHDDESLLAEARDLVRDRAILCELCRRRMRYFPASDEEVVRGFGRGFNWRCESCMAGPLVVASRLTGRGILPIDWYRQWHTIAAAIVIQYTELSRAHARHRLPLFAAALDRLCMQLQLIGQVLADYGDAVALGNVIPLTLRPAQPVDRRGQAGADLAPAAL
jgi:hypothetical protein